MERLFIINLAKRMEVVVRLTSPHLSIKVSVSLSSPLKVINYTQSARQLNSRLSQLHLEPISTDWRYRAFSRLLSQRLKALKCPHRLHLHQRLPSNISNSTFHWRLLYFRKSTRNSRKKWPWLQPPMILRRVTISSSLSNKWWYQPAIKQSYQDLYQDW